jgi:NADH-quinone oxidoreductase subunit C
MPPLEQIRERLLASLPGSSISLIENRGTAAQHSLLVDREHAIAIARFLRDDPELRLDYCSNVTGVDWLAREIVENVKKAVPAPDGQGTTEIEEKITQTLPGFFEVVYHLYSVVRKHGPVALRVRTVNREDDIRVPSLTPVWRSCEFQEREIFDLFGVVFDGHPDLRRILMWDQFTDHPMRKDYVPPDDDEWEPTAHGKKAE